MIQSKVPTFPLTRSTMKKMSRSRHQWEPKEQCEGPPTVIAYLTREPFAILSPKRGTNKEAIDFIIFSI